MANPNWGASLPQPPPQPPSDAHQAGYAHAYWQHQHPAQQAASLGQQQQQWPTYGSVGAQQQWQQAGPPPPPPPGLGGNSKPPPAGDAAGYPVAYGHAYGRYGQWQQPQQYGGYGWSYAAAQQQQWGWQQHNYDGAWQQQQPSAGYNAGYDYRQQQAGAWPGSGPVPLPEPSQHPAASGHAAALAQPVSDPSVSASQQQQQQQQQYHAASYAAVPPPAALANAPVVAVGGRRAFTIRPQLPKPKPPESASPLVAAFNQAAAKLGGHSAAPAYTRVQVGIGAASGVQQQQQQHQAALIGPQQWPPALKSYVERSFKACDMRQRPKLQEVMKQVIGDAQTSGELWTRDWAAMPLPDLSQSAADAAAVLAEVAAVTAPPATARAGAGAGPGRAVAGGAWSTAAGNATAQQQYAQYAQQQQKQVGRQAQRLRADTGDGRKGRKRSYRGDDSESSCSGSEEEQWTYAEQQRRKRRAGRFASAGGSGKASSTWKAEERRQQLLAVLEEGDDEDADWDALAIKGTFHELEKSYFRLTSAPDPATIRPEPVLRRALDRLVGLLRAKKVPYFYALDQFKGMRQDCTVQHIRNDLTVQVYEAHGRAALEYGDLAEFNQCQSQLRVLYNEGVPGSQCEFLGYRLIYQSVHAKHGEILQLLNTLKKVTREEAAQPQVVHALAVRASLAAADYPHFFRLYATAPGLGRALMDIAVPNLRFDALRVLTKAFLPTVPLSFLAVLLGFVAPAPHGCASTSGRGAVDAAAASAAAGAGKSVGGEPSELGGATAAGIEGPAAAAAGGAPAVDDSELLPGCMEARFQGEHVAKMDTVEGCQDCIQFLLECGATVLNADTAEAALDCKASAGQLKMPVAKERVAHDDANLTVDAFLKSAMAF